MAALNAVGKIARRRDGTVPDVDVDVAVAFMFTIDTQGHRIRIGCAPRAFRRDRGVLNVDRDVPVALMIGVDTMGLMRAVS